MDLISIFVILTLIGSVPFLWMLLRSIPSIKSDDKYLDNPVESVLQELKKTVDDRLQTISNISTQKEINFNELSYGSFREIFLFNKTPLREAVFSAVRNGSQITAVARFLRNQIDEIGINKYLVVILTNGDNYEIIEKQARQHEIILFRNDTIIGQLKRRPSTAKGVSKLFDYDVWDIFVESQHWGELKNHGRIVTWSSYKIFNQKFQEGLPVKISENEDSFLKSLCKCLLLMGMFFTFWTLWPYWFNKTSWSKSKLFNSVNEDTVLLPVKHDLSSKEMEVYFLISIFLRLVIFGRDYRSSDG